MNIQPLLDALGIQEDAARALADDLRTQTAALQARLREAETHLEHLAITRKTVTALADRIPVQGRLDRSAGAHGLPPHPRRLQRGHAAPSGPATSAKPSTTNRCRRTSRAPAPS